jgi:hypothetical protein
MSERPPSDLPIPVLTEVIRNAASIDGHDLEVLLASVQTKLASRAFALTDELLRSAFAEMEATLFAQISGELRRQLPELIDATLREHFEARSEPQGRP